MQHSTKREKAFSCEFGKYALICNKDGFIGIGCNEEEIAVEILNTIMGVLLMIGFPAHAVRPRELSQIEINTESQTIGSSRSELSTMRAMLNVSFGRDYLLFDHSRQLFLESEILDLMRKSQGIHKIPKLAELLRFMLEAETHLFNSDYSPAFMLGWIVLERHISEVWAASLRKKELSKESRRKMLNTAQWPIDNIIETLNLNSEIELSTYTLLIDLKNKRNNFMHRGYVIAQRDAERCLQLAKEILKEKLSGFL